jgi:hypothetical protein
VNVFGFTVYKLGVAMIGRAGGVLSEVIRRLCVVRSEGFLQATTCPDTDGMQLGMRSWTGRRVVAFVAV